MNYRSTTRSVIGNVAGIFATLLPLSSKYTYSGLYTIFTQTIAAQLYVSAVP
jgi:hypothetical protein